MEVDPTSPQPGPSGAQGGRSTDHEPQAGPSGAQGSRRRAPLEFEDVVIISEDEDAPATPPPNFSNMEDEDEDDEGDGEDEMEQDEHALLGGDRDDSSSDDSFQRV